MVKDDTNVDEKLTKVKVEQRSNMQTESQQRMTNKIHSEQKMTMINIENNRQSEQNSNMNGDDLELQEVANVKK